MRPGAGPIGTTRTIEPILACGLKAHRSHRSHRRPVMTTKLVATYVKDHRFGRLDNRRAQALFIAAEYGEALYKAGRIEFADWRMLIDGEAIESMGAGGVFPWLREAYEIALEKIIPAAGEPFVPTVRKNRTRKIQIGVGYSGGCAGVNVFRVRAQSSGLGRRRRRIKMPERRKPPVFSSIDEAEAVINDLRIVVRHHEKKLVQALAVAALAGEGTLNRAVLNCSESEIAAAIVALKAATATLAAVTAPAVFAVVRAEFARVEAMADLAAAQAAYEAMLGGAED